MKQNRNSKGFRGRQVPVRIAKKRGPGKQRLLGKKADIIYKVREHAIILFTRRYRRYSP